MHGNLEPEEHVWYDAASVDETVNVGIGTYTPRPDGTYEIDEDES